VKPLIAVLSTGEPEENWLKLNRERGQLIDKSIAGTLSQVERQRLAWLQEYADRHLEPIRLRGGRA